MTVISKSKNEHSQDPRTDRLILETRNDDLRGSTQVDRDRVLYTPQFARLAEVTQVVSADYGYVFHNRLTHSLKVAQLARRMSEYFEETLGKEKLKQVGGLDADAAECAALIHDMGHPPFGHLAEKVLNKCAGEAGLQDGFEGNAQSFRLVCRVAVGDGIREDQRFVRIKKGLNLTRATLNGVLKYPWYHVKEHPKKKKKWGAYLTERAHFDFARTHFEFGDDVKSLEAEIMDWADDITYAVHDVIDFYCAGKIPLERLVAKDSTERDEFFAAVFERNAEEPLFQNRQKQMREAFDRIIDDIFDKYPYRPYTGKRYERVETWQIITKLITRFVRAIYVDPSKTSLVRIDEKCRDEIEVLKQLTWHYVILNNDLATVQDGQKKIVRQVFEILEEDSRSTNKKLFPPFYEIELKELRVKDEQSEVGLDENHLRLRLVVDYISGMTEKEIVNLHSKVMGVKVGMHH